jgi:hypothetical protein
MIANRVRASRTVRGEGAGKVRKYLIVGFVVLVVAVVAVLVWPGHLLRSSSSVRVAEPEAYGHGQPVPAGAAATVQRLGSGTEAEQHAALDPDLAASLPVGVLFPAGAVIALDSDSWEQTGQYANATGLLSEPGSAAKPVEIGFVDSAGTWLVTFEEALP